MIVSSKVEVEIKIASPSAARGVQIEHLSGKRERQSNFLRNFPVRVFAEIIASQPLENKWVRTTIIREHIARPIDRNQQQKK